MKKIFGILAIMFGTGVIFSGCYYDKEELVYPSSTCDTANVTFTSTIQPILQSRCYSCHSGSGGGISGTSLESYQNFSALSNDALRRITIPDVNHPDFMPQGGPKLSDCEIAKIKVWIEKGKPQ